MANEFATPPVPKVKVALTHVAVNDDPFTDAVTVPWFATPAPQPLFPVVELGLVELLQAATVIAPSTSNITLTRINPPFLFDGVDRR
jgi:hypothetical protein